MHVLSLNKKAIEFNFMSVFCSKTLIFALECWKCILEQTTHDYIQHKQK